MKYLIILGLLLLFIIPSSLAAKTGHITLLTVSEQNEKRFGGTADLYLELKPGSGRIFIDSFPLTKLDTQISTRFANEMACKTLEMDCSTYDFFYTINSGSTIVGGPSAGAGISVLTVAMLLDLPLNNSISITGTINSGGIVGPVAGIYEKIAAAQNIGMAKVVIPRWASFNETEFTNTTKQNLTVQVGLAGNLAEAVKEFTGHELNGEDGEIEISERYQDRMMAVADILCNRADNIADEIDDLGEVHENFTLRRSVAYNNSRYYTAASYCFSRNVQLREELLRNETQIEKLNRVSQLARVMGKLENKIDEKSLLTLSDLETYMVVKERLIDATQSLTELDLGDISSSQLAYLTERYFSAVAWSQFYGLGGKAFTLEQDQLKVACTKKISEAEERIDYVGTINPRALTNTRRELTYAYRDMEETNYALCIFKSSKAKAEADMYLLGISVKEEDLPRIIEEKLEATKRVILKQQKTGTFPILGYSYYEYADSLKESSPTSALLFSEYALEMSNLDLYFPVESKFRIPRFNTELVLLFIGGLILGFVIGILVTRKKNKTKSKKNRKPKKARKPSREKEVS